MIKLPVIAIFDVGKTNKKLLLFDRNYQVVLEESRQLEESADEDGFPCEEVETLTQWVKECVDRIGKDERFDVRAVNFSAYGASFVYLDAGGKPAAPLYNYLKPFPDALRQKFYRTYGGESLVAKQTASPVLGHLNSGMQLYRIKEEKPDLFQNIRCALHLPQYLSYLITGVQHTDITSLGCHTNLWHFQKQQYHDWVSKEGLLEKFAPLKNAREIAGTSASGIPAGVGLHDSSAALIPYLASFREPFILLSTGTWCISLNPFNHSQLSDYELDHDCLCYLSYEGKPVKASRLFAGYEHEKQVKKLAAHFGTSADAYTRTEPNPVLIRQLKQAGSGSQATRKGAMAGESAFGSRNLDSYASYEEAYHQLIADLVEQQVHSTNLVLKGTAVKKIFVDGGFGKNGIYMQLLAESFPGIQVFAASVAQATALGAALALHPHWNPQPLPAGCIQLQSYSRELV